MDTSTGGAGQELSRSLAAVVEKVGASVVRIEGRRPATGVAWSADGLVVAAHHSVDRDEQVTVGLPDGVEVPASVVGRDPTTDVALLRLARGALPVPDWSAGEDVRVGHLALALLRPGRTIRARLGIVSVLGEAFRTPAGGRLDRYLEADVLPQPGISGGPLVDLAGRVLGLDTAGVVRGAVLAVPTPTVRRVVDSLLAHGRIRRGYLGVGSYPVRIPAPHAAAIGSDAGLLVVGVEPDSPAARAGVLLGDTILALDGQHVDEPGALLALLSEERIGKAVPVKLLRAGELKELSVTVGQRP